MRKYKNILQTPEIRLINLILPVLEKTKKNLTVSEEAYSICSRYP